VKGREEENNTRKMTSATKGALNFPLEADLHKQIKYILK